MTAPVVSGWTVEGQHLTSVNTAQYCLKQQPTVTDGNQWSPIATSGHLSVNVRREFHGLEQFLLFVVEPAVLLRIGALEE